MHVLVTFVEKDTDKIRVTREVRVTEEADLELVRGIKAEAYTVLAANVVTPADADLLLITISTARFTTLHRRETP